MTTITTFDAEHTLTDIMTHYLKPNSRTQTCNPLILELITFSSDTENRSEDVDGLDWHSTIIRTMRWEFNRSLLLRLLAPLILVPMLAVAPRPHALTQLYLSAQEAIEAGNFSIAAARLAELAERLPSKVDLWEQAGLLALEGGNVPSAVAYLERARSSQALSIEGQIALGDAYQMEGEGDKAVAIWESTALSDQVPAGVYQRLLDFHLGQGNFAQAIADLQALTSIQPAQANFRYQLGLLLAASQPQAALPHLAQAAELDSTLAGPAEKLSESIQRARREQDPAYTLVEAGRALATMEEWQLAAEAFQRATQTRSDYADAWAFLGEARQHLESNDTDQDGLADLQKALELAPDSFSANTLIALYWQRQGQYAQALQNLESLSKLHPDNPTLQAELGATLAELGRLEQALAAYQRAVDLAPNDPVYLTHLANFTVRYEYLVRPVGLAAARQAVIQGQDDALALDVMGQVLVMLEDTDNAERFFERALKSDTDYAPAHLHLGLVYALQGESTRAYRKWKLVQSLAPGSPAAEQAQRLLESYFP